MFNLTDLFYNQQIICENVINNLPHRYIILEMMDHAIIVEAQKTIKEIDSGNAVWSPSPWE